MRAHIEGALVKNLLNRLRALEGLMPQGENRRVALSHQQSMCSWLPWLIRT